MNSTYCKNQLVVSLLVVGVFLASAFLFISMAQAAEEAQIEAAIKDLSSATGQDIKSEDQAKDLCNQERYLDVCADIGKKHELYAPEELKQVDNFLSEVKGKILDDIKSCADEECLVKVATELAQKIKTKNPTLAKDLNLTTKVVEEKKAVVQAAKEVGVNFQDCESMDPDTAPVDLLRKCARLAKDTRIQKYIPEEKRALVNQFDDRTIKLREALSAGKYQCGDGTLEGCGNYCLNPSATTGTAGIPPVCAQIASEIFGQEGVKQLEAAHQQVGQVREYYSDKFILVLPNGKKLAGENQIKNACSEAFSGQVNNIETAKACGNFAVKNGFASQAEVERGIKLMESFAQKGQNTDFNKCIADPAACRDFIPEDERERFDVGGQIFDIMKSEIGFDPFQCERGAVDQTIGTKCFEGSKRALAKIESLGLATQSKEAKFIVEDIKKHVAQGEEFMNKKDEFNQVFNQQGGPGGCKSGAECFTYCSNPTNGPECISFGAKQQISGFRGEEAVQKFQEYNQNLQKPGLTSSEYTGQYQQFSGQGPYPGFQPPGQGGYIPPGQFPGFTQPGPGFGPSPGVGGFYPGPGPVGPSPECFAAIQSGDFAKAKTVCSSPNFSIPLPTTQICPAFPYVECPAGQYRESFKNENGCWIDGPCKSAPTYSPGPYPTGPYPSYGEYKGDANSCPGFAHSKWDQNGKRYCRLNETSSCHYSYPGYLDRANYLPGNCPNEYGGPYPTYSAGPGGWTNKTWKFKDGSTQFSSILSRTDSEYITFINGVYNDCSTKYFTGWKPGGGDQNNWQEFGIPVCSSTASTYTPYPTYSPYPTSTGGAGGIYSCFYPNATINGKSPGYTVWCEKDYYNCHQGDKSGAPVSLSGLSLGAPSSCESGYTGQSCNNNKFCDSNETYASCPSDCGGTYSPVPTTSGCPSGYHYHGESGGFCMNDQENYSGTCYNSTGTSKISCPQPTYSPYPSPSGTPTSGGSCPSGSYTVYVNNAGGYCKSNTDSTKCGPLNSSSVSSFGSCSSYQTSTSSPYPTYSYSPPPSCPSGQWWDTARSSCTSTASSCSAGYYWDSVSFACQPNNTTSYTPYPSCPSGQWWDYSTSSCKSNTTYSYSPPPSCPSGQWWDYATNTCKSSTSTYSPTPGGSYSPYPTYTQPPTYSPTYSSYSPPPFSPSPTYSLPPAESYTPPPSTYSPPPASSATPPPYSPPPIESYSPPPPPPPTSGLYPHYIVAHCQQLGRTWDGSKCQANGLFARIYENNVANILRFFYIVP